MEPWSAAIDFSTERLALAIGNPESEQILFETSAEFPGRESSGIFLWLEVQFRNFGISHRSISHWTIGTGPGNFTSLRLISALISGLTFERPGINVRGLPSALAPAAVVQPRVGDCVTVIFPGRKGRESARVRVWRDNESDYRAEPAVIGKGPDGSEMGNAPQVRLGYCVSGPSAGEFQMADYPAGKLLFLNPGMWHRDSLYELEYVRPAVHVEPKMPRTVPGV